MPPSQRTGLHGFDLNRLPSGIAAPLEWYNDEANLARYGVTEAERNRMIGNLPGSPGFGPAGERYTSNALFAQMHPRLARALGNVPSDFSDKLYGVSPEEHAANQAAAEAGRNLGYGGIPTQYPAQPASQYPDREGFSGGSMRFSGGASAVPAKPSTPLDWGRINNQAEGRFTTNVDVTAKPGTLSFNDTNKLRTANGLPPLSRAEYNAIGGGSSNSGTRAAGPPSGSPFQGAGPVATSGPYEGARFGESTWTPPVMTGQRPSFEGTSAPTYMGGQGRPSGGGQAPYKAPQPAYQKPAAQPSFAPRPNISWQGPSSNTSLQFPSPPGAVSNAGPAGASNFFRPNYGNRSGFGG